MGAFIEIGALIRIGGSLKKQKNKFEGGTYWKEGTKSNPHSA